MPDTGRINAYRSGGGFGVRLDAGNAFPRICNYILIMIHYL